MTSGDAIYATRLHRPASTVNLLVCTLPQACQASGPDDSGEGHLQPLLWQFVETSPAQDHWHAPFRPRRPSLGLLRARDVQDVGLPSSRSERFESRLQQWIRFQPDLQLLRNGVLGRFLEPDLLTGLFQFDGFVEVVSQGGLQGCDFPERREFDPSPGLRMLSSPLEYVLCVFEQSTFEERKRARLLKRDDDGYVLLQKSEAGLAPLQFLRQIAVECDFAQSVGFLQPLLCIGDLHRVSLFRRDE
jgi:hypothetical protein